ncbi:MAG: serine--tRNA ligase [Nanoarchaeota archaeon]|nr:serine--tRNA ligase [Nanoarchaeota archaeon]
MLDIRFIRENPEIVKDNMEKKFREDTHIVDDLLAKDEEYRKLLQESERLRHERNQVTQKINDLKKSGGDITALLSQAKAIPARIKDIEEKQGSLKEEIVDLLKKIPNILDESVPVGKDSSENVERVRYGDPIMKGFPVKSHVELCEALGIADFDSSARVAGNGFFYLFGDLALLNQALIRFAMDFMIKRGYVFMEPPLMVRREVCDGMVDFNFFREIIYKIEGEDLYMIPTAEFPLVAMFINQVIEKKRLPIKLCGYSQCFRKEVGAHGIDEKGLFRTHQFNKVEQVIICEPEDSYRYYDELLQNSIDIFKELGLPTRVFESCSGDLGDLKAKGADLEAWSPRKEGYFEVGSVSNLTDCQSRRLNIKVDDGKERYFPHTLNNTAIATSRAMVAILENFQNEDGSITIPDVLGPYMNNMSRIEPKR